MTRSVPSRASVRTVARFTFAGRGSRDPRREPRRRPQPLQALPPSATTTAPPADTPPPSA